MPRNITVTFDDGSSHVYENAPDDATPEAVTERAEKDFSGKKVASLDGGKKSATAVPPEKPITTSEDGRPLTEDTQRMEKLARKANIEKGGVGSLLKGVGEAGLSMATGLAGMAEGGLRGVASMLNSDEPLSDKSLDSATKTIKDTVAKRTYKPRTAVGALLTDVAGQVGEAPGHMGSAALGPIGQAVNGDQGRIAGESLGEAAPAILPMVSGLKSVIQASRNRPALSVDNSRGARMLNKAMEDMTPEEIAQAKNLVQASIDNGVPLTGPEAFEIAPKLHELVNSVDKSNNIISRFLKERPQQAKDAIQSKLDQIGEKVGTQEAANAAQEAATGVIDNAQKFRTEVASPDYKAQRASDSEALDLMREIKTKQKDIKDGTAWKNDAIQQAGKWYQFSHEMGLKANDIATKIKEWAGDEVGPRKAADNPNEGLLYHGGSYEPGRPINGVLFTSPSKAIAKEFGEIGEAPGKVSSMRHTGKNAARDTEVLIEAEKLGMNTKANTVAQLFDSNVNPEAAQLAWNLRKKGYDHAIVSEGASTKGEAHVLFNDVDTFHAAEKPLPKIEQPVKDFESEGGTLDPNADKLGTYMSRAEEGKSATIDAVNEARNRQNYIDGWKDEIGTAADKLAEKNLPVIQDKIHNFIGNLNKRIELANPATTEGQILMQFRNELAPEGKALMLPSQLESVYKTARDKLELGLQPTALERTTAGVLRGDVRRLDALIQEVSPAIKQGRQLYSEISKEFVDPLMKSPIGRIAGKGADAQKEMVIGRVKAELQGDIANPDRIRALAKELTAVDPEAFPNIVRAHLEDKFDAASAVKLGQNDRLTGAKFAEAIAKSPKERANLSTMIEKVAEAQGKTPIEARQAGRGFSEFMEVLRATGRIAKIGVQGIDESTMLEKVALGAPHLKSYGAAKAIYTSIGEFINKKAYKNLAQIFTDKDAIDKMVKLANLKKEKQERRQQIAADILDSATQASIGAAMAPENKP